MSNHESVILLHGLARSHHSLDKLAALLSEQGYHTVNYDYPSTRYPIERLADEAISTALAHCPVGSKINFVTHSMGGILVRQYLSHHVIENLGRVVMLGPPNKGSEVVDSLQSMPGFWMVNGPAGMQLGTGAASVPNALGAANFDLGIIAGARSVNLFLSTLIAGKNDGKVSVENTKLAGMKDHLTLPVTHPFMMNNDAVIAQVLHYLRYGRFNRRGVRTAQSPRR